MPPRKHRILCGHGRKDGGGGKAWQSAQTVRLDTTPGTGNVQLQIHDITRRMVANLPPIAEDLIELATYVYAADQASERGSLVRFDYGHQWRRSFRFEVPVRCPDVWSSPAVNEELVRTLSFLSDDDYEFSFSKLKKPTRLPEYLQYTSATDKVPGEIDTVMLFSGGLDSLAGAVEEVLLQNRRVALVSHRPVSKIDNRQTTLRGLLRDRARQPRTPPRHVPILANKSGWKGKDFTQRTRSFLFASFAAIVARLFGLDLVKFYENGIVSCNLPICAQVLGGRASRTTHPRVLTGFERLFSRLFERKFTIQNPFFWKTRTDVIEGVLAAGHADLTAATVSCAHTWQGSSAQPHCGTCSQCVDRRLAALSAHLTDAQDPAGRYQVQLLTGHLEDVLDQTMVERVVGTARDIERITTPLAFVQRYGEVSRLLGQIPGRSDEVASRVFEMHRRHARQVTSVLDRELAVGPRIGTWKDLPPTCLLRVLAGEGPTDAVRLVSGDGHHEPSRASSHTPTREDWNILNALNGAKHTLVQQVLIERLDPKLSRRTVGKRLTVLSHYQLVHFPNGSKKGAMLSDAGRALVAGRRELSTAQ